MRSHLFQFAQKPLLTCLCVPKRSPQTRGVTTSGEPLEPVSLSYATYENATSTVETNPLLIMHGLFGSKSNWNSLCKMYQKRSQPQRKVIAIDARNHGESPHDDNHTYAHLAADVKALYEQLGIQRAAVMGHSMGGRAMMLFALKYPELVERLIVADISPVTTSPNLDSMPEIFRAMESVNLPAKIPMSRARADVDRQLSKAIPDKGLRAFLLTNLIGTDDGSYNWRLNMSVLLSNFNSLARFPLTNDLRYPGPVLFVGGSNSDYLLYISSTSSKKIARKTIDSVKSNNLDLAFASYECTKSYSDKNPQPTPLFVLHDLLGSKNNWNSFCKRIHSGTKAKIIAIDARNHGESPHFDLNSYDDLVFDLKRFIEQNNMKKVRLLGHSVGGRTAMLFALKYPDLVEKLIVVDISPISSSSTWKQIRQILEMLDKLHLPAGGTLAEAAKTVGESLSMIVKRKALVSFLLTNLVKRNDGSFAWRFNIKALLQNFEHLESFPKVHNLVYNGPVLFISGARSDHIQKSDFPKILELFPNAELKYIEGAGHWLHSEKPTEFLNLTLEFLNKDVPSHISK